MEGREAFQGKVDVLVTDGFSGNVFLKTAEGISSFIFHYLQKRIKDDSLDELQQHFSYDEYPGAIVCGVDGVVVKCHGEATTRAMEKSIQGAITFVEKQVISQIKQELS